MKWDCLLGSPDRHQFTHCLPQNVFEFTPEHWTCSLLSTQGVSFVPLDCVEASLVVLSSPLLWFNVYSQPFQLCASWVLNWSRWFASLPVLTKWPFNQYPLHEKPFSDPEFRELALLGGWPRGCHSDGGLQVCTQVLRRVQQGKPKWKERPPLRS